MSIKLVRELLPSSQQWFVDKGYAIRCKEEDGFLSLKLTKAGEEYFARITRGETNGKDNKRN